MFQLLVIIGFVGLILALLTRPFRRSAPQIQYVLIHEPAERGGGGGAFLVLLLVIMAVVWASAV